MTLVALRRAQLNAELAYAYRQFRSHLHDPWAEYCYPCDVPGPCQMYHHWLNRLRALEAAEEALPDNDDTDIPDDTALTTFHDPEHLPAPIGKPFPHRKGAGS